MRYRHTDTPICPHCGMYQTEFDEFDYDHDEEIVYECEDCEKLMEVEIHSEITYSTTDKIKQA